VRICMKYIGAAITYLIYTLVYVFLVFATLQEAKGTFFFADMLVGWPLFTVAFFTKSSFPSLSLVCISLFYIASILILVIEQMGDGNFERTLTLFTRDPLLVAVTFCWFIAGQVLLCVILYRNALLKPEHRRL